MEFMKMTFENFYDLLLCELAKRSFILTKKQGKRNDIRLENRKVFVRTKKSGLKYEEIPLDFIKTAYDYLVENGEVTQNHLSKELNVKRSAFIISAFSLIEDSILYVKEENKIILIK